jgi:LPS-assembly protein
MASAATPPSDPGTAASSRSSAAETTALASARATETESSKRETAQDPGQDLDGTAGAGSGPAGTATSRDLHEGLSWDYCGPRPPSMGPAELPPEPSEKDLLFVSADTFDYDQELALLSLGGDVAIGQGSRQVRADRIVYDRESADLVATGDAFVSNPGFRMTADRAEMNLDTDRGRIEDVQYRLTGRANARGSADQAELLGPKQTQYQNITYTACPPNQRDWTLEAAELDIDQEEGVGVARHAKLRVGDVPVLYTPYLSFPIDGRRKSGILVPSIGNSEENGFDLMVPYYWNIAPNMDATIFPRIMSNRGVMLGTEFRYLSAAQEAEVYGEIIPEDSRYEGDSPRGAIRLEHTGRYGSHFGGRWASSLNVNAVSDNEYLEDSGNQLEITSTRNLERRGDLTYSAPRWALLTRLQSFQTVDAAVSPENRPYGRMPQLVLSTSPYRMESGLQLGVGAEYNYFSHNTKVHGHRAALQPYAVWPLRKSYGHLIPKVDLYLAGYGLQDQDVDKSDSPSYAIPSFNLDGELVFERTVQWFDHESLQTLEPRIFYLYTPFKDQEDIPVFDSSELSFSFNSLFRQNRFTGRDRIGDANQLTLGLTSRTLATTSGLELFRASVGQVLYFRDREVQINGLPEDESTSAIAGELSARFLPNWRGRASFEWDPNREQDQSQKRVLELNYQTPEERLVNLAYRFDLGATEAARYEDTDLSFSWPVNPRLQFVGRWFYSILNDKTMEAFAGVEFGRCCWRMRLLGRHLKNRPDSNGTNSVMVQVELAGLGSIGQRIDNFLERGIYGYHAE